MTKSDTIYMMTKSDTIYINHEQNLAVGVFKTNKNALRSRNILYYTCSRNLLGPILSGSMLGGSSSGVGVEGTHLDVAISPQSLVAASVVLIPSDKAVGRIIISNLLSTPRPFVREVCFHFQSDSHGLAF